MSATLISMASPASSSLAIGTTFGRYTETLNRGGGQSPRADDTTTGLISNDGVFYNTSVAWESDNTYESLRQGVDNDEEKLMDGYIDISSSDRDLTVSFTDIPFPSFDLYVYVGSDGTPDRKAYIDINVTDGATDGLEGPFGDGFYFVANTGRTPVGDVFSGRDTYVQATATSAATAFEANYAFWQAVPAGPGGSLLVRVEGVDSNAGIHGIQIVESNDMTLLVDTATGQVAIANSDGSSTIDFDIDYYEIASESGAINVEGMQGLAERDLEGNGAPGDGNGWEILGTPSSEAVREAFLQGSTVFGLGDAVRLGAAYTLGAAQDLVFTIHSADTNVTRQGKVVYGDNILSLQGDYNSDGVVDSQDYALWRETLGSTADLRANGDDFGTSRGVIDEKDLQAWRLGYGGAEAAASPAAAPEPNALFFAVVLFVAASQRRGGVLCV